ncbi:RecA-like DNA recombinase [Streptomyces phage Moab]|nr:RecA-like DNA recombinase [Streptomyces phage Moab]WMI33697.1 RecA-like DNA recombinase [Streptomyces phage Patelgo]
MSFEDFVSKLDPKTAKRLQVAQDIETTQLPLASIGLTHALNGGIGTGRVATIYGNQSSGKSLVLMQTIGQLQKQGFVCAYGDAEGTYTKEFGAKLGINNDELVYAKKKSTGAMTDTIIPWIEAGVDLLIVDSISDLLPEVFVDTDGGVKQFADMKQIGAHAKSITAMLNAIHYANEKTAVVLISQTTTKIENTYVQQVPHGGQKVLFGSSQIIKLTSSNTDSKQIKGMVQQGDRLVEKPIGRKVDLLVEKNKLGPQHRRCSYDMYYDGPAPGVDLAGEVFDMAVDFGVVKKSGAWYDYQDKTVYTQGRPAFLDEIKNDDELYSQLKKEVNIALNGGVIDE